jgi:chromosome segregation ATPase
MDDFDQLKRRFDDLMRRYEVAKSKKEQLKGELSAKKRELVDLDAEIRAAGHDTKNIKVEREKAKKTLVEMLDQFEADLGSVEEALSAYDEQQQG